MKQETVILGSLWQVTIYAAFQRAKVYKENISQEDKTHLKECLQSSINNVMGSYESKVSEKDHIKNIEKIKKSVDKKWGHILDQSSISYGVVQKAFNLHLKLMWCLKKIPEPPHCPLDSIIIRHLSIKDRENWTGIRDIQIYKTLISKLQNIAKESNMSLAQWELMTYKKT